MVAAVGRPDELAFLGGRAYWEWLFGSLGSVGEGGAQVEHGPARRDCKRRASQKEQTQ